MLYCGIDPSLNQTGICILSEKNEIIECYTLPEKPTTKMELEDRIIMLIDEFEESIMKYLPHIHINIEGISYGSTGRAVVQIASVNMSFRMFMRRNDIPFEVTPPTTLKKMVV